jgi:pilus assembly protein CpaB
MARQQTGGRTRALMFLLGSIVAAGLTSGLVVQLLRQSRARLEEASRPPELVSVVIAKRDLYVGLPITDEDVLVVQLAPNMIPNDLVFDSADSVVRRVPRERILANEPLRAERLAQKEAGIGLNAIIATGKRAMTVETDTESGLAGMLQPGNYVDIIVTIRPDDANISAKWVTETILQGIRVLAVGSSMGGVAKEEEASSSRRRNRPSVTMELTLNEAEKLALASSKGDIHLVLRNDVDITQQTTAAPLSTASLIGYPEEAPAAASTTNRVGNGRRNNTPRETEASPTQTVEIIGNEHPSTVEYDEDGNKIDNNGRRNR